jgi:D-alanyl-lipoteichoic acid acyltransferase DltB (MBOAT superfamily)
MISTVGTLSPSLAFIFWLLFFVIPPFGYFVVPISRDDRPQLIQTATLLLVTLAASFTILAMGTDGVLVVMALAFAWHLWWTALLDLSRKLKKNTGISSVFSVTVTGYVDYIARFIRFIASKIAFKKSRS